MTKTMRLGTVNGVPGYTTLLDASGTAVCCTADMPNPVAYAFTQYPTAVKATNGKQRADYEERFNWVVKDAATRQYQAYLDFGNRMAGFASKG